jgi:hypothetical protein
MAFETILGGELLDVLLEGLFRGGLQCVEFLVLGGARKHESEAQNGEREFQSRIR